MPHAIVTGGASGIGAQSVLQLAAQGWDVSVLDLSPAEEVVAQAGGGVKGYQVDISDRGGVHRVVAQAVESAGRLDAVIGAAGVWGEELSLDELTEVELDRVVRINFHGAVWTAQASMPHLRAAHGRLVLVGSEAGRVGGRRVGVPYASSKGAIHTLVRTLARQEVPNGVLVNGVAPGLTETPMVAGRGYDATARVIGRAADPAEIASVVVFLCSPGASYVSGAVIDVNGAEHVS